MKYLYSRGYLLGVGSGSRKEDVVIPLEKLGLNKFFKVIITGDDAVHGKPSPEIFLKAARILKVKPGDCIVFEDSIEGVHAGRNAGMKVVAIATSTPKKELREIADLVIDDYTQITL